MLPPTVLHDADVLCVRCARHTLTCCQQREIYVTLEDVSRISDFTGLNDFTEFRSPQNPAYADQDDDPTWSENVFRKDGTRRLLKQQANGDCTFLSEQGCRLPLETRPLVCRLYPYDYTADGIREELSPGCPLELLRPEQTVIEAVDMNIDDACRWHKQLYEEIQLENEDE